MSALKMKSLDVARTVCLKPGAVGLGLSVTDIFRLFFVRKPIFLVKVISDSSLPCNKWPDFNADKEHLTLPTDFITLLRYGTPR